MTPGETRSAVAHLVRRAGFGATARQIDDLARNGYEHAVDTLVDGLTATDEAADALSKPTFDTGALLAARGGTQAEKRAARRQAREEQTQLVLWWLRRMAVADHPLREKLTLLWHDHFATSVHKVKLAELMHAQRQTLYELGAGRFDTLLSAVVRDPAMLVWLDGTDSVAGSPNENFAREFFELFTLGHGAGGHHGGQPYSEADVQGAARAFTGWKVQRSAMTAQLRARLHDAGTKTVLGVTGPLDGDGVVAATVASPACAPHVVGRLWSRLARPAGPDDPVVRELAESFADDLDTAAVLRRIFLHPEFLAPATRQGLVKMPIELVVGAARTFGSTVTRRHVDALVDLGQVPFDPPDVAGWPANEGWLSTSSAQARLAWATTMVRTSGLGAGEDAAAVAHVLGIDAWGPTTTAALAGATDPRQLLTLALVAPEHVLA